MLFRLYLDLDYSGGLLFEYIDIEKETYKLFEEFIKKYGDEECNIYIERDLTYNLSDFRFKKVMNTCNCQDCCAITTYKVYDRLLDNLYRIGEIEEPDLTGKYLEQYIDIKLRELLKK
jgi:hypothetical protein